MHALASERNVCVNSIDCCAWTTAAEGTMLLTSIHKGIINEMIWLMKQTLLSTNNSTQNKLLQSAAVRDPHQTLRAVRSLQWPFTLMEGGLVGLSNKPLSVQLWKSLDVCFLLQLLFQCIFLLHWSIYYHIFFDLRISSYVLLLKYLRPYIGYIGLFFLQREANFRSDFKLHVFGR